ncbi:MAG TPA: adenine deaminase C-terminal domain-containing protein, partial [Anaerolineae bacterium]|nr:adenine deaminase C-terminal domain-containing protein [Anaerolineae bacterium]
DDEDLATAINAIIDMQGGQVVVNKGQVIASLPLRIAGLIAEEESNVVYDRMKQLTHAAKDLGAKPSDPFMTLSFVTLATVPKLKITDKGLVDVPAGKLVSLFA